MFNRGGKIKQLLYSNESTVILVKIYLLKHAIKSTQVKVLSVLFKVYFKCWEATVVK